MMSLSGKLYACLFAHMWTIRNICFHATAPVSACNCLYSLLQTKMVQHIRKKHPEFAQLANSIHTPLTTAVISSAPAVINADGTTTEAVVVRKTTRVMCTWRSNPKGICKNFYFTEILFMGENGTFIWEDYYRYSLICGTTRLSLHKHYSPPSHTRQACQSSCLRGRKSQQRNYKTHYSSENTEMSNFQTTSMCQVIFYVRNSGNITFSWKLVDTCKDHLQPEVHMEKLLASEEKELSSSKLKKEKRNFKRTVLFQISGL